MFSTLGGVGAGWLKVVSREDCIRWFQLSMVVSGYHNHGKEKKVALVGVWDVIVTMRDTAWHMQYKRILQ